MGLKVVQGVIETAPGSSPGRTGSQNGQSSVNHQQISNNPAQAQEAAKSAAAAVQYVVTSSDAVLTTVRAIRTNSGENEKLRESSDADSVARDVSDLIEANGNEALEAHKSLNATDARGHFN